jgi:hypothetical protein
VFSGIRNKKSCAFNDYRGFYHVWLEVLKNDVR